MASSTPTFSEATAVRAESKTTYSATFPEGWCIGSVPHGGFVTSCFMKAASLHFSTTRQAQNQPHTIALHLTFLRRTEVGAALFTVTDVKMGRQTSTIHMELSQDVGGDGSASSSTRRIEVVGYITRSNIPAEDGPSFTTNWALQPPPPAGTPSSFRITEQGELVDSNGIWKEAGPLPFAEFRKATRCVKFLFPAGGQKIRAATDQWMALRCGERFTNDSLGFVCDMFPQLIEVLLSQDYAQKKSEGKAEDKNEKSETSVARYWFPTVLLNLDIKKALPEEGVPWIFMRCRAKVIQNGRYDLEIVILDEEGDVVALSHHVCLVVDAKRNLKGRSGREKTEKSEETKKITKL